MAMAARRLEAFQIDDEVELVPGFDAALLGRATVLGSVVPVYDDGIVAQLEAERGIVFPSVAGGAHPADARGHRMIPLTRAEAEALDIPLPVEMEDATIGATVRGTTYAAVIDYERAVELLAAGSEVDPDDEDADPYTDAIEFISFNWEGGWSGDHTPLFLVRGCDLCGDPDGGECACTIEEASALRRAA